MQEIKFLNIDLDIESHDDISSIVKEFEQTTIVMNHDHIDGIHRASFETSSGNIVEIVEKYYSLVSNLTQENKQIWDNCIKRVFDFGYESGFNPRSFHSEIPEHSLKLLSSIGGTIVITIYPIDKQRT